MDRPQGSWEAATQFFIRHAVAIFLVATVVCLLLAGYLTNYLNPSVVGVWVVVGLLTSLLFSGVALVVVLAVAAVDKARRLRLVSLEPRADMAFTDRFANEKLRVEDFYCPHPLKNEGKAFMDCELRGPGAARFGKGVSLEACTFQLCDFVVLEDLCRTNTAAVFADSSFTRCKWVKVTVFVSKAVAGELGPSLVNENEEPCLLGQTD
ncbi:hypothetical protein [Solidesulfovibrio sp.]|uniref:hypothetical protein n=1 Tax=Solidesulfovibrio sp. TaxID=2910990 RepID=UPI002634BD25|nr:hypothetical protein [Solidesulfovibrio sp.]